MGGITAWIGPNGSGKTLTAIEHACVPALEQGRPVLTANVTLHPEVYGWNPRLYVHLTDMSQLLDPPEHAVILLDEIGSLFGARGWKAMPGQIATRLQQLRKRDFDVHWTAPSWNRADVILREITQDVWQCRAMFRKHGDKWKARAIIATQFDSQDYLAGKVKNMLAAGAAGRSKFHLVKHTKAHRIYDTKEVADLWFTNTLTDGTCLFCGKTRKTEYCTEPAHWPAGRATPAPPPAPLAPTDRNPLQLVTTNGHHFAPPSP